MSRLKSRSSGRLIAAISLFYLVFLVLVSRAFYLQIYKHSYFAKKAESQLKRIITLSPNRGRIYDRNELPLAVSEKCFSAYAIPIDIEDGYTFAKIVSKELGLDFEWMYKQLKPRRHFVWIKRKLTQKEYEAVSSHELKGLKFVEEDRRVYPHKNLASSVIGFVGVDNQGLGGLEYEFDSLLKGTAGTIILEGDPRGRPLVSGSMSEKEKHDGGYIWTTLDAYVQYRAQVYLREAIERHQAQSGSVIVMNPKSGDIFAMANYPNFDPNSYEEYPAKNRRNSCVNGVYEPGSTFKIMTIAACLEEDLVVTSTMMTVPETLTVWDRVISEAHKRPEGETDDKTVATIFTESLNVGTSLLAMSLGQKKFYRYIRDFGFGQETSIELPGESRGILRPVKSWSGVDTAMMSFGQGVAVTPLQLITAVAAIGNDGFLVKPRIVDHFSDAQAFRVTAVPKKTLRRVVSPKTAATMRELMEDVMVDGTGKFLSVKGFGIGGKTGTAQRAKEDGRGYEKGAYVSSFVGMFPIDDPQFVVLVVIDKPQKQYYGASVAGPVFRNLVQDIIQYYNMNPDRVGQLAEVRTK